MKRLPAINYASDIKVGIQTHGDGDNAAVYLANKLFLEEANYSTIEKKEMALKWAIDMLKVYL